MILKGHFFAGFCRIANPLGGFIKCSDGFHKGPLMEAISARMSSTLQAVVRGPIFMGLGKRPDLTPAHHVAALTGMIAGTGGFALGLPRI
jgi:hypothetical protein